MPLIRKDHGAGPPDGAQAKDPLAGLASASTEERWAAARQAATLDGGLAALNAALARETDPRVREAMFTGLARIGTPDSVEAVEPFLRSDDALVRTQALDALCAMPEAIGARLAMLLDDSDPDVRVLACEIVRGVRGPDAVRLLTELLERDPEPNVCGSAVEVLAEIGDPAVIPVLQRCADRFASEPFLRFAISAAADRIAGRREAGRG